MKPVKALTDDEFVRQVRRAVEQLPDAPEAWQRAAIGQWPQGSSWSEVVAAGQALVGAVWATLRFDSWSSSGLALGMRSGRSATRHLLFSAEGRDVDLRIAPQHGHYVLNGQILGPDETGRIELLPVGTPSTTARPLAGSLDALGEFRLEGVEPGRYQLRLTLGTATIVVPELDVGEPQR